MSTSNHVKLLFSALQSRMQSVLPETNGGDDWLMYDSRSWWSAVQSLPGAGGGQALLRRSRLSGATPLVHTPDLTSNAQKPMRDMTVGLPFAIRASCAIAQSELHISCVVTICSFFRETKDDVGPIYKQRLNERIQAGEQISLSSLCRCPPRPTKAPAPISGSSQHLRAGRLGAGEGSASPP